MPKVSSTDATIHDTQDLIRALYNTAPASLISTRKWTQVNMKIPKGYIWLKKPSYHYFQGCQSGGHTKKNPTGEPIINPNKKAS